MPTKRNYPTDQIFDPHLERRPYERPTRVISKYDFLNQSSNFVEQQVRIFLEELLLLVPDEYRTDFLGHLQTQDDFDFQSKVFELLILGLFIRSGWVLKEIERPGYKGRKPDFLFENPSKQKLYVEATVILGMTKKEQDKEKIINSILHEFDCIESSRFWLELRYSGSPRNISKRKEIARKVKRWVNEIELIDSISDIQPYKTNIEGMSITIRPLQERNTRKTNDLTFGLEERWSRSPNFEKQLLEKLKSKSRYKHLDYPLLIAVNNVQIRNHIANLVSALFGRKSDDEQFTDIESSSRCLWLHQDQWQNTSVSGVLFLNRLDAWNAANSTGVLAMHPKSKLKLPNLNIPFGKLVVRDSSFFVENGIPMYIPLGLTKFWPNA